ncbi:MAG: chaperone NapD [Dissulfuribacterales bacterium]
MPIAGLVIGVEPQFMHQAAQAISTLKGIEIYGWNEDNIVAVVESKTSKEIEQAQHELQQQPGVLSVSVTYLNVEDEVCP